tara:strand:- start:111 stop:1457 length:1347 start_codon:yes stop_codon:yes gene_type:complete
VINNLNKFFFTLTITIGFYIFFFQYNILISENLNFKQINIKNKEIKIDKKTNFSKENYEGTSPFVNLKKNELEAKKSNKINKDLLINNDLLKKEIRILKGDTFVSILKNFFSSDKIIFDIVNEIEKSFDLKKIKENETIIFYENLNKEVEIIEIFISLDKILRVNVNEKIKAEVFKLEKSYFQDAKEFLISESLYSDGLKNDLPQEILIKLIKLFSFDLDFQRDIKKDTLVSVSYEFNEININNKIEYKDIKYALISINGKELEYFKYVTNDGFTDYFNREGKNVKKSILKTPLDGARISSNFGMRKHPISGFNKMHKGVDFAAPKGTPIYAGGNGVIEFIGRNGGYGNYIRIRHNNEYKTAYAHLASFKKGISRGVRVNQGDIIGYVGSTGNSTGPHLHYEILFQNKQINPMKLKLPSGKILAGNELINFKKEYKKIYANHLNLLYE